MKLEQKAWGCPSYYFFCTLNEGAEEMGYGNSLILPSSALLRVPCRGNSILATVEIIPCRLPFSSHMAHLCFGLTHKCTSHERCHLGMWVASFTVSQHRTPEGFYLTHQDATLLKTFCGFQGGWVCKKGFQTKLNRDDVHLLDQNNRGLPLIIYFPSWLIGSHSFKAIVYYMYIILKGRKKGKLWHVTNYGDPHLEFVLCIKPIQVHKHSIEHTNNVNTQTMWTHTRSSG